MSVKGRKIIDCNGRFDPDYDDTSWTCRSATFAELQFEADKSER